MGNLSLPPKLYNELCSTLLNCGPFTTDQALNAIFVHERLRPWRNLLPEANNRQERVEGIIAFLSHQHSPQGDNGLVLLLHVLSERRDPQDACHNQLLNLADSVTQHRRKLNEHTHSETNEANIYTLVRKITEAILQIINAVLSYVRRDEARDRIGMLKLLRHNWIESPLKNSLNTDTIIMLDMTKSLNYTDGGQNMIYKQIYQDEPHPVGTKIVNLLYPFTPADTLLILGEPGSGKTTLLLDFAREAVSLAEKDQSLPIPVIFNLSSWASRRQSIADWLQRELHKQYKVPRKVARNWVKNNQLLLLLDGLDEVNIKYRNDCVQALNYFVKNYKMPVVVCSRINDYEILKDQLGFKQAVLLQPLTDLQIQEYLTCVQLDPLVVTLIQEDPILYELAQTPFMLNIIVSVYRHKDSDELKQFNSLEAKKIHIFKSYIDQRLNQVQKKHKKYTSHYVTQRLSYMAEQLNRHSQSEFLLEQLQPSWLPNRIALTNYNVLDRIGSTLMAWASLSLFFYAIVAGYGFISKPDDIYYDDLFQDSLVYGLIGAAIAGLFGGHEIQSDTGRLLSFLDITIGGVLGAITLWFLGFIATQSTQHALFFGVMGVAIGVFVGPPHFRPRRITLMETVRWSLEGTLRLMPIRVVIYTLLGLIMANIFGVLDGFIGYLVDHGFIASVMAWVILGILISFVFGTTYSKLPDKVFPNQGISQTAKQSVWAFGQGAFIGGMAGFLMSSGPVNWLIFAFTGGIISSVAHGGQAVFSHCILRFIMNRHVTSNYSIKFLDYCTERRVLKRLGGSYIFIHRSILDYFTTLDHKPVTLNQVSGTQSKYQTLLTKWLDGLIIVTFLGIIVSMIWFSTLPSDTTKPSSYSIEVIPGQNIKSGINFYDKINIKKGDIITTEAKGLVFVGTFSGRINADGMERGFMGLPLGGNNELFGIPMGQKPTRLILGFPKGVLLCRVQNQNDERDKNQNWRKCGTKSTFIAGQDGHLEFLINDQGGAHDGYFYVTIDIKS